jgi:hypothetical protein
VGKKNKSVANIIDTEKYHLKICCYDLFKEIWDEHPKRLKELPILTVISIAKDIHFYGENIKELDKYKEQIEKYFNPSLDESIIDIQISNIPRNIVIEEGLTQFEAENRDFYYIDVIKYILNKDDLYKFYFSDYDEWDSMDYHVAENMFEHFIRKIFGIQPSIKLPNVRLCELVFVKFLIEGDKDWFKSALEILNNFKTFLPKEGMNAFSEFILNSYISIENKLKAEKIISTCGHCGQVFAYKENKKYCLSQCRRKAQRRRYYLKYGDKIRRKAKKYMELSRKEGNYIDKRRYFKSLKKGDTEKENRSL